MIILGIDPGEKPGYCLRYHGAPATILRHFDALWIGLPIDIVAFETQHVRRRGTVHHKTPLSLAVTAGWQMAQAHAQLRLGLPPAIWRGMLWTDGYAGGYGLDGDATIKRLRGWLPELADKSEDECEAAGIEAAARMIGTAAKGVLRCGQAWKRIKQPWGFRIEAVSARAKARAFIKGMRK